MDIVRTWMSSPAITAPESLTLPEAQQMLAQARIRRLPVVDAAGRLVGIVTASDISRVSDSAAIDRHEYDLTHRAAAMPLSAIMSRPVISVAPDTPILEVARLLLANRIGGVPVEEGGRVVGVITESDLFRLIVVQKTQVVEPDGELDLMIPL